MYTDVIYTPSTRLYSPMDGGLFDDQNIRIEASRIKRHLTDTPDDMEPLVFQSNPDELPVYEWPVLYIGRILEHYGHFLLESLATWWPLVEDIGDIDRYLLHVCDKELLEKPYVKAFLTAAGINQDNLVYFDKTTRLKQVLVANTSFQLESHIHDEYKSIMNRLAERLGGEDVTETDQPAYISRRSVDFGVVGYRDEDKLETFLEERGVQIVHPQYLSLSEQIKVYNRHRVIIGIAGSGMHNTVFQLKPHKNIWLSPSWMNYSALLTEKCWGSDSTHIYAIRNYKINKLKNVINNRVWKTLTGYRRRTDNFVGWEDLDTERLKTWFLKSGILS